MCMRVKDGTSGALGLTGPLNIPEWTWDRDLRFSSKFLEKLAVRFRQKVEVELWLSSADG